MKIRKKNSAKGCTYDSCKETEHKVRHLGRRWIALERIYETCNAIEDNIQQWRKKQIMHDENESTYDNHTGTHCKIQPIHRGGNEKERTHENINATKRTHKEWNETKRNIPEWKRKIDVVPGKSGTEKHTVSEKKKACSTEQKSKYAAQNRKNKHTMRMKGLQQYATWQGLRNSMHRERMHNKCTWYTTVLKWKVRTGTDIMKNRTQKI